MTTMSNPGFGQYPGEQPFAEQRTSIMAILSLVFGLICFIPGFALLGALFGIGGLIAIARADGRLGGRGLAVAGLVLSLLVMFAWGGLAVGAVKVWGVFQVEALEPAAQTMTAIEQSDYVKARQMLSTEAAKQISDSDFDAFNAGYMGELGHFKGTPTTLPGLVRGYTATAQMMQQLQGRNDAIPIPADFDNGPGLLVFQINPSSRGQKPVQGSVNIMVVAPSGNKWTLYDPARGTGPGAEKPIETKPVAPKPRRGRGSGSGPSTPPSTTPTPSPTPTPTPGEPETPPDAPKPGPG